MFRHPVQLRIQPERRIHEIRECTTSLILLNYTNYPQVASKRFTRIPQVTEVKTEQRVLNQKFTYINLIHDFINDCQSVFRIPLSLSLSNHLTLKKRFT